MLRYRGSRTMKIKRTVKLNAEYQKAISEIIRKLKNPYITEMVSVLKVDTSEDLSHAKVYLSIFSLDSEKKNRTFTEIEKSAGRVRRELASAVRTRIVPELHFILDDSMEYSDKINKLIEKANENLSSDEN
ncbi:MAG: 30S ribosome-binding factor RbfA [Clostridiales bacterium]|nr:30S ribosome-binding factor RbfA [Clostridiales bacterium]